MPWSHPTVNVNIIIGVSTSEEGYRKVRGYMSICILALFDCLLINAIINWFDFKDIEYAETLSRTIQPSIIAPLISLCIQALSKTQASNGKPKKGGVPLHFIIFGEQVSPAKQTAMALESRLPVVVTSQVPGSDAHPGFGADLQIRHIHLLPDALDAGQSNFLRVFADQHKDRDYCVPPWLQIF